MAEYDIKINRELLVGLLSENEAFGNLLTDVINQILEQQMTEHLGAQRYEQVEERSGYRNGYRMRTLYTRVGPLTLRVPQTRDGSFNTEIFKRYQRHEQAFVLGLMEMYLQGVSTRKVAAITEELCGVSFSKSTVSQLCVELDARLMAWKNRPLKDKKYPFLIVDALVVDIRDNEAIRPQGVLIAYGINEQGQREPLDLLIADSENETSWDSLFKCLKERGLAGVDLVVSDNHSGLVQALKKQFQGAQWQRCQVHFMRNILGLATKQHRSDMANELKLIFMAEDKTTALALAKRFMDTFAAKAPRAVEVFEQGLEQALAVLQYPKPYRTRLRTTNLAERMNEEIRRRQRVIRIFPNPAAALRLIGALLADTYENWQQQNRYFDMALYWDWKQALAEKNQSDNKIALIK